MEGRRGIFILFLLFFLFTAPSPHPSSAITRREHERQLEEERRALALVNGSSYGDLEARSDRWLPLSGLSKSDGYAWDLLPLVQQKARNQLQYVLDASGLKPWGILSSETKLANVSLPVYRNTTGQVHGDWVRATDTASLDRPNLNITAILHEHGYFSREFAHNVTASSGRLFLKLQEGDGQSLNVDGQQVREIKADLELRNDKSLVGNWFISLHGVHFPSFGGIILSTTSEKFAGLPALPHFSLSNDTFELSRQLLNRSLADALTENQLWRPQFMPWSSLPQESTAVTYPAPRCEYIMYLQQHILAVDGRILPEKAVDRVEKELRFPTGAPIPKPPPLVMSGTIFSPDCGFILETKGSPDFPPTDNLYLVGLKQEEHNKYASRFIAIIGAILIAQILLLMRQMKDSSTPSTRSKVSFFSISIMSMGDALFVSFVLLVLYTESAFLVLEAISFLAFFGVSFLGMKFQIEIWAVQAPERRETQRLNASTANSTTDPSLPLPVTAQRHRDTGATPVILPPDHDAPNNSAESRRRDDEPVNTGAMYARFYFILCGLLFFSLWVLFWPESLRTIYINTLSFIYLSFWTPQIYRNTMRNCRKALRYDFVVGESILRIFPFLYFYFFPHNVLYIRADGLSTFLLFAWVWIQVWILVSQDILGPRFFVSKGWVPPAYDYHPILRDASGSGSGEDLEAGGTLPISLLRAEQQEASSSSRERNKLANQDQRTRYFSCAICMHDIEVYVLLASGSGTRTGTSVTEGATNLLSRRLYMVTPCRHIFHSQCLETWMRLRLQCPICRESVPPV
ncbi:hypothetical protein FQN57_003951 [Myotisia sp. PD_48]|nr:hypothetical protein FQN57_003951 [Myotisia sp. PD_48]